MVINTEYNNTGPFYGIRQSTSACTSGGAMHLMFRSMRDEKRGGEERKEAERQRCRGEIEMERKQRRARDGEI